ncbi:MAG TPA: hypothetical protein PKB15_08205 [Acidimicrobiia bacterium]|nr:hypothetical protein [Acidimicrobiia bacterium]
MSKAEVKRFFEDADAASQTLSEYVISSKDEWFVDDEELNILRCAAYAHGIEDCWDDLTTDERTNFFHVVEKAITTKEPADEQDNLATIWCTGFLEALNVSNEAILEFLGPESLKYTSSFHGLNN